MESNEIFEKLVKLAPGDLKGATALLKPVLPGLIVGLVASLAKGAAAGKSTEAVQGIIVALTLDTVERTKAVLQQKQQQSMTPSTN